MHLTTKSAMAISMVSLFHVSSAVLNVNVKFTMFRDTDVVKSGTVTSDGTNLILKFPYDYCDTDWSAEDTTKEIPHENLKEYVKKDAHVGKQIFSGRRQQNEMAYQYQISTKKKGKVYRFYATYDGAHELDEFLKYINVESEICYFNEAQEKLAAGLKYMIREKQQVLQGLAKQIKAAKERKAAQGNVEREDSPEHSDDLSDSDSEGKIYGEELIVKRRSTTVAKPDTEKIFKTMSEMLRGVTHIMVYIEKDQVMYWDHRTDTRGPLTNHNVHKFMKLGIKDEKARERSGY